VITLGLSKKYKGNLTLEKCINLLGTIHQIKKTKEKEKRSSQHKYSKCLVKSNRHFLQTPNQEQTSSSEKEYLTIMYTKHS
jgi:hypothetical protein